MISQKKHKKVKMSKKHKNVKPSKKHKRVKMSKKHKRVKRGGMDNQPNLAALQEIIQQNNNQIQLLQEQYNALIAAIHELDGDFNIDDLIQAIDDAYPSVTLNNNLDNVYNSDTEP